MTTHLRTCAFCGARRLTREHAWPQWLVAQLVGVRRVRMLVKRGVGANEESWPASDPGIIIKRFCKQCNNDWMGRLEDEAKPLIESLLSNSARSLDSDAAYTIARWTVKTAMVIETAIPERFWYFSQADRHRFRHLHALPRGTQVWVARVGHHDSLFGSGHTNSGLKRSAVALEHSHTATMAFGSLALQVHTVRAAPSVSMLYNVLGQPGHRQWDGHVLRLWPLPSAPLLWPPRDALDRVEEVEAFARRFDPPPSNGAA